MDTPAQDKRIVILGGGFGGLYAALYLDRTVARDPGVEVILIDPQNFAVFTPMLHEVASGSLDASSIVVPIRHALRRVEFVEADATAIDFAARTVTIVYGLEGRAAKIRFDYAEYTAERATALCTSRSRIPSANVGSPTCSCHRETGSCDVRMVERTW